MITPHALVATYAVGEIGNLIAQTGPVAKTVLLILLIFSLISWSIILSKWSSFRRARVQSGRFLRAFRKALRLQDVSAVSEQFKPSPLVSVFEQGYEEYRRQTSGGGAPRNPASIQRATQIAASEEMTRLERRLPWLATTGAVTPFIGLFGTVWGIMTSFQSIAASKNTSLAVVAPGIAEALFATAIGLVAAIPATIFYNKFVSEVNKQAGRLEGFADEFAAILSRQIDEAA